jgi:hypothetical protein
LFFEVISTCLLLCTFPVPNRRIYCGFQQSKKKNKDNDFWYDVGGWVILAVGFAAWIAMAKNQPAPQQQAPHM